MKRDLRNILPRANRRFEKKKGNNNSNAMNHRSNDDDTYNGHYQRSSSGQSIITWQSDQDTAERKLMIARIVRILKKRKANPSNEWIRRLPQMARKLEVKLYRSARSKDEYVDATTLKQRLENLALTIGHRVRRHQMLQQQQSRNIPIHGQLPTPDATTSQQSILNHPETPQQVTSTTTGQIQTIMTIELQTNCMMFHQRMLLLPHARIFQSPVAPQDLGLPDYSGLIQHPMDLGTIQTKLQQGIYSTLEEYSADVHLTFDNAMACNSSNDEESFVWKVASEMKHKFIQDFDLFKRENNK
mmetsp:Transcript_17060/g.23709  ORF Transcript_17060/g.23709 Transcript_17060/m.23709 type:complete len:300 (-) Transcript_17060:574-1473(-)